LKLIACACEGTELPAETWTTGVDPERIVGSFASKVYGRNESWVGRLDRCDLWSREYSGGRTCDSGCAYAGYQ
jgi:hypothetical protein